MINSKYANSLVHLFFGGVVIQPESKSLTVTNIVQKLHDDGLQSTWFRLVYENLRFLATV